MDLRQSWKTFARNSRFGCVMGWVPSVSRAASVDRRDRWELQLYGIDVFSSEALLVSRVEKFGAKIPESVV